MSTWYSLQEHAELRKRGSYCLLVDGRLQDFWVLHPSEALVLSLLDGELDVNELTFLMAETYRLSSSDARCRVDAVLERTKPALCVSREPHRHVRRYDPEAFVFPGFDKRPGHTEPLESPAAIDLMLTARCNFACRYCYFRSGQRLTPDLSLDLALSAFEEAADMGVALVNLGGGEPLLYPHISELVSAIREAGMALAAFSTNGLLLHEKMIRDLLSAGLESIQVSVDSPNAETHDYLTRTRGTLEPVLQGVRSLKAHEAWVRTRSVIGPANCDEVADLIDLLAELGVDRIDIGPEESGSCEVQCPKAVDTLTEAQAAQVRRTVKNKADQYGDRVISYHDNEAPWKKGQVRVRCGNLYASCVICPTGNVTLCEMTCNTPELSYGNLRRQSLRDVWLGPAHQRLLEKTADPSRVDKECAVCGLLPYCRTGCFNLSEVHKGDFFAKDPRCRGPYNAEGKGSHSGVSLP